MKTIGLIGGTTWLSTAEYYRIINRQVNKHLGGASSARIILYSVNFEELKPPADMAGWTTTAAAFTAIARKVEQAGAECLLLCANTPHMIADRVQEKIKIPLIHIATETAKQVNRANKSRVALLGTRITMEQAFFKDSLSEKNIETLIPTETQREFINSTIFNEMDRGIFNESTKQKYLDIIRDLKDRGAEGVIFGCTEIPLLIPKDECPLTVFDTIIIHATAAVDFALREHFKTTQ